MAGLIFLWQHQPAPSGGSGDGGSYDRRSRTASRLKRARRPRRWDDPVRRAISTPGPPALPAGLTDIDLLLLLGL